MRPTEHRPLGEILLQARVITPQQLEEAVAFQRQHGGRLGEALVRLGFATEGHSVEVVESGTRMLEVQTGPVDDSGARDRVELEGRDA